MRGLPMGFANDEKVNNMGDEFMFGLSFLIAPVTAYHQLNRNVYLLAVQGWYELYSGKYYDGGQNLNADAPYERIPVFVNEGSVITTGPAMQYADEKKPAIITLFVFTGKDAFFNLYEDEGTNYNYEQGHFANINIDYNEALKTLAIDKRQGSFNGMFKNRVLKVVFINKQHKVGFDDLNKTETIIKYLGEKISIKEH